MKKYIILLLLIIFLFLASVFAILFFDFSRDESGFHVRLEDSSRELIKKIAKKVSGVIYREATEHNPEGDVLPDGIDDRIKGEIKERF
jgi:hypothetical protein